MDVVKFIEVLIVMFGVILIYDARPITKKIFSFGDRNEGVIGLKVLGYIFTVIGGIMMFFI